MATASYLEAVAGGMVAAAAFDDDDAGMLAVQQLRAAGVREQDISVVAADQGRAARIAGDSAWLPFRKWSGMRIRLTKLIARLLPGGGVPKEVRERYGPLLRKGKVVVIAAAGGQPPDTIAALLEQVQGEKVDQWWQSPCYLFAPPELAGPF
ncbi:MAG: general stress protein [Chloroflexota bacterium]|nr:general stress protein [Chloroflexota bacterium]